MGGWIVGRTFHSTFVSLKANIAKAASISKNWKLFKEGNYSREKNIRGNTVPYVRYLISKIQMRLQNVFGSMILRKEEWGLNSRTYVPLDICILWSQCRKSSFHLDNRQHYCIHFPIVHPDNLCKLKRMNVLLMPSPFVSSKRFWLCPSAYPSG